MLKRRLLNLLLLCVLLLSLSCKTNKKGAATKGCQTIGTVKDFTGMDGCKLLIVLDNGDKLLPAKVNDKNFTLQDGQQIKFDYKELDNMASICMMEKAAIEITCIELMGDMPIIPECFNTNDPLQVEWMKTIMDEKELASIEKFKFRTDGWAYLFYYDSKQLLYDCQGTLLCEHEGRSPNACKTKFLSGAKGKIIYRANGSR